MELEYIIKLIDKVSASELTEFKIEEGDSKLTFKANRGITYVEQVSPVSTVSAQSQVKAAVSTTEIMEHAAIVEGNLIKAPLVGTFYTAADSSKEAFISIGDQVKKGQVIGIIEAMKLMNEVESEFDGVVTEILVENEQMVEYGQPLVIIK